MKNGTLVRAEGTLFRRILLASFLAVMTAGGSCNNATTLFQSNFDTTLDQPPSPTQTVGTAEISGDPGSVLVSAAPPDASPPAKWLKVTRASNPGAQVSAFRGKMIGTPANGTYVVTTTLVVPSGNAGPATVQLESVTGEGFLHLDFMPDGKVRLDDDASTTFGSFNLGQVFIVQITLNVNDTTPTAHIILSGAAASGEADRTIISAFRPRAQQFGAVRLLMGFPNTGSLHATNIVVKKNN